MTLRALVVGAGLVTLLAACGDAGNYSGYPSSYVYPYGYCVDPYSCGCVDPYSCGFYDPYAPYAVVTPATATSATASGTATATATPATATSATATATATATSAGVTSPLATATSAGVTSPLATATSAGATSPLATATATSATATATSPLATSASSLALLAAPHPCSAGDATCELRTVGTGVNAALEWALGSVTQLMQVAGPGAASAGPADLPAPGATGAAATFRLSLDRGRPGTARWRLDARPLGGAGDFRRVAAGNWDRSGAVERGQVGVDLDRLAAVAPAASGHAGLLLASWASGRGGRATVAQLVGFRAGAGIGAPIDATLAASTTGPDEAEVRLETPAVASGAPAVIDGRWTRAGGWIAGPLDAAGDGGVDSFPAGVPAPEPPPASIAAAGP